MKHKKLAEQAWLITNQDTEENNQEYLNDLDRFAELVRDDERGICAKHYLVIVEQIRKDEREACAKLCEAQENKLVKSHPARIEFNPDSMMARKCATAIRARGNE